MWHELLVALALLLVIEGIMPFLNPEAMRRTLRMVLEWDNRTLRMLGLVSMLSGTILLYVVN